MSGYRGPGRYRHYKGGEYEVLGLALREDSVERGGDGTAVGKGERFVLYRPLTPGSLLGTPGYDDCEFWAREVGDFNAIVRGSHRFSFLPCLDCDVADLVAIDHPVNANDWGGSGSNQSYQVYRCRRCRHYWGCRHQWDAGTGHDDRWYRFGDVDPATIQRHY